MTTLSERQQMTPNERTKDRAARRKAALAKTVSKNFDKIGERQRRLIRLYANQKGKCQICGLKAILDGNGGKAGHPDSAVCFRKKSGFGKKGAVRHRVMVHRKCAQARSAEIEDSIPVEERWLRSGRSPSVFYETPDHA